MAQLTLEAANDILMSSPISMLMLNKNGEIQWYNNALLNALGLESAQLDGQTQDTLSAELRSVLIEPPEIILLQDGSDQRWLRTNLQVNSDGSRLHAYIDISTEQQLKNERDKLVEELQQLATRDAITGLPNRQALLQGLEPLVSRSRRYNNPLSVINLNISTDKPLTDASLHSALLSVGQMLKDQMRWADIIGRYEGEDFLLILPETPAEAAQQLADKITGLVHDIELHDESGAEIKLRAHCGTASWTKGDDAATMLKKANDNISSTKSAASTA